MDTLSVFKDADSALTIQLSGNRQLFATSGVLIVNINVEM